MINFESVIRSWLQKVRTEVSAARSETDEFIIDHLSTFIKVAVNSARKQNDSYLLSQCRENAKLHGRQRAARKTYSSEAIAIEYSLLREIILAALSALQLTKEDETETLVGRIFRFSDRNINHRV